MPWVLDLDGVIRLGEQPVPGAAEAVALLRAAGEEVVFATNNAYRTIVDQEASLAAMGIPADGAVVGAAQAGASLLRADERVTCRSSRPLGRRRRPPLAGEAHPGVIAAPWGRQHRGSGSTAEAYGRSPLPSAAALP